MLESLALLVCDAALLIKRGRQPALQDVFPDLDEQCATFRFTLLLRVQDHKWHHTLGLWKTSRRE